MVVLSFCGLAGIHCVHFRAVDWLSWIIQSSPQAQQAVYKHCARRKLDWIMYENFGPKKGSKNMLETRMKRSGDTYCTLRDPLDTIMWRTSFTSVCALRTKNVKWLQNKITRRTSFFFGHYDHFLRSLTFELHSTDHVSSLSARAGHDVNDATVHCTKVRVSHVTARMATEGVQL